MSGIARNLPLMLAAAVATLLITAVESQECARIDRKALECGSRNGEARCCPGAKCSGDDDKKEETQIPERGLAQIPHKRPRWLKLPFANEGDFLARILDTKLISERPRCKSLGFE